MKTIQIKTPIWSSRSVGLNVQGLKPEEKVIVEITYEKKDGTRLYPDSFEILVEKVLEYQKQTVSRGIVVYLVPISALTLCKKEEDKSQLSLFN